MVGKASATIFSEKVVSGSLSTDIYKSPSLKPRSVKEAGLAFVYVTPFKV